MADLTESQQGSSKATLPQALHALCEAAPTEAALIDALTDRQVTRAEFDAENRAWARRLAALGVSSGDTVATLMGPTFDAYNAWLGLSGLGAIEVPINPQLRGRTLTYLLNHSRAKTAIVHAASMGHLAEVAPDLECLRTIVVSDAQVGDARLVEVPFETVDAERFRSLAKDVDFHLAERHDTACIIYTSGTTGPPKGVVIPWGWLASVENLVPARISAGAYYSFLSPAHMSGKSSLNNATMSRRTLVLRETFSVKAFWSDIAKYRCTVTQLFPQQIKYLLNASPPTPADADTPLEYFWTAPLIQETREFMRRYDLAVTTGFGSTEIGGPIAGIDVDGRNFRTCGRVNPDSRGYEIRLVDEHDREVPTGEVGELIVRTSVPWTLNVGYFRDAESTAAAWRNGWFHTGDAMKQDQEGNFYFVDRFKDCIRRKGENISSFEVEAFALGHPGVAEAAAVAVASADGEDEVKLWVVPRSEGLDLGALGAWLAEKMPKFMTPRYLEATTEFQKTPATGRIQKSVLRSRAASPHEWDRNRQHEAKN